VGLILLREKFTLEKRKTGRVDLNAGNSCLKIVRTVTERYAMKSKKNKELTVPTSLKELLARRPTASFYIADKSISGFELRVYDNSGNLIDWSYPMSFTVSPGRYEING
jgi:hypothetical protein